MSVCLYFSTTYFSNLFFIFSMCKIQAARSMGGWRRRPTIWAKTRQFVVLLKNSSENIRDMFMKQKFISDDWKLSNLAKKVIENFGGKLQFSAGAAIPPPFLHSSILHLLKATTMPNIRAVTLYWVEFLWLLVLVSIPPPPFVLKSNWQ